MNRELTDAVTAVAGARAGSAMAGISTLLSNSWIDSKDELLEVYSNRDSGDAWKQLLNDAKDLKVDPGQRLSVSVKTCNSSSRPPKQCAGR